MGDQSLKFITIKGFKSIQAVENFPLNNLNILIGANGAGKSNFISVFRLLRAMIDQNLALYISEHGGPHSFLFNGPKVTEKIEMEFVFGQNGYRFGLKPTADERMTFIYEATLYIPSKEWWQIGTAHYEAVVKNLNNQIGQYINKGLSSWIVYHFHDTSSTSPMRRSEIVQDTAYLRHDGANIAPFLLHLRENHKKSYENIVNTVKLIAPFFEQFILEVKQQGERESVRLGWKQVVSDYPMQPYHLSDGTLRFICLATTLLQPKLPTTIVIDEPELGLHPYAIAILAELIQAAATQTQIIIATQSPTLIDHFEPEDLIVVNRKQGASTFERVNKTELEFWLEKYSLGELWQKNVISGEPTYDEHL